MLKQFLAWGAGILLIASISPPRLCGDFYGTSFRLHIILGCFHQAFYFFLLHSIPRLQWYFSFISSSVIKHLVRNVFNWVTAYSSSLREAKAETKGSELEIGIKVETTEEWYLLACSL